jgi:hypothetical protein
MQNTIYLLLQAPGTICLVSCVDFYFSMIERFRNLTCEGSGFLLGYLSPGVLLELYALSDIPLGF